MDVILFPVGGSDPRLVQMPFEIMVDGADIGDRTHYWEYKKRTGLSQYFPRHLQYTHVGRNGRCGSPLGRVLEVMHAWNDVGTETTALPMNKCIKGITGDGPAMTWYGNVVVTRVGHTTMGLMGATEGDFEDATLEDLAPIELFFQTVCHEDDTSGRTIKPRLDGLDDIFGPDLKHW